MCEVEVSDDAGMIGDGGLNGGGLFGRHFVLNGGVLQDQTYISFKGAKASI